MVLTTLSNMVAVRKQNQPVELNYSPMIVNQLKSIQMNILGHKNVRATKENRYKNDCPLQCNKNHCDVCPFRDDYSKKIQTITVTTPPPEVVGRDFY